MSCSKTGGWLGRAGFDEGYRLQRGLFDGRRDAGLTGCLLKVYLRASFGIYSSLALCPAARLGVGWAVRGSMNLLGVKKEEY